MADLEFSGTPEQRQAQGEAFMRRIHSDFYGNGRPGLMSVSLDFFAGHMATEKERAQQQLLRHRENSAKLDQINQRLSKRSLAWTIAGVAVAFAALIVAALGVVLMVRTARVGNIHDIIGGRNLPTLSESTAGGTEMPNH